MSQLDWIEPLTLIKKIPAAEQCWALLYSGMRTDFTGRYSYLAIRPEKQIISQDFKELERALLNSATPTLPSPSRGGGLGWGWAKWFGYLGYGLKNALENLPQDNPGILNLPNLWMVNYKTILIFDHDEKKIECLSTDKFDFANFFSKNETSEKTPVSWLKSNMSKPEYLTKIAKIKEHIFAGDIYQANLTRKFYGEFKNPPSAAQIFTELAEKSPAPYSTIMKFEDNYIISSSPEMFLKIDAAGNIESRPIKGSIEKEKSPETLEKSSKDRAENLMIVDLVRNDLSRSALPGSVSVKNLFTVSSYSHLHHMSSTITAKKKPDISSLQVIKDCFPPGSMTGTPKIKAMEICSEIEGMARGVYSGALGWISASGEAELSVVIRTIILNGKKFEFQVGGAITAESIPEKEWEETIFKAKGITETLGIKNLI